MSIDNFTICPICGKSLTHEIKPSTDYFYYINCDACGRFALDEDYYDDYIDVRSPEASKSEIASYLYYHKAHLPFPYISNNGVDIPSRHRLVNIAEIKNWYPKTFSDKVDMFLLDIAKKTVFFGEEILLSREELFSAFFVERDLLGSLIYQLEALNAQVQYYIDYLTNQNYVHSHKNGLVIQPKGFERIDSLQLENRSNGKNVFVSMSFSDNTKLTREALRNAIIDAEFSPEFIDEIIHNKQIVPEMFRLIRESRFLILEISDPNYGAYYEAGYALGLGKEVIICCSKEVFNKKYESDEEKKYAKYLCPHFDIAQKQILVWDDYLDLRKKLTEWIKELFN